MTLQVKQFGWEVLHSYYNYYTDMKWGEAKNYDLCINSSKTGVDGAIKLMKAYIEIKEANADK